MSRRIDGRELLRRVIAARDDERARLARDLHDRVGQQLTALRMVLERHQGHCRVNSPAALHDALTLLHQIDDEIDSLAWERWPRVVDEMDLAASLRQLVRRWANCAPVDAECHCDVAPGQLSREAEMTVYRVAQEALHNVMKHAHATHVDVITEVRGNSVMLIVQDDGVGFDPPADRETPCGMGLRVMRERAALAGGTLSVESTRGCGTTVSLQIPGSEVDRARRTVVPREQ